MSNTADCRFREQVTVALRVGLAASLGAILVAFAWMEASGRSPGEAVPLRMLPGALLSGDPTALLSLAILILLATPAATIVVAGVYFLRSRERGWAGLALAVLVLLALGVVVSLR